MHQNGRVEWAHLGYKSINCVLFSGLIYRYSTKCKRVVSFLFLLIIFFFCIIINFLHFPGFTIIWEFLPPPPLFSILHDRAINFLSQFAIPKFPGLDLLLFLCFPSPVFSSYTQTIGFSVFYEIYYLRHSCHLIIFPSLPASFSSLSYNGPYIILRIFFFEQYRDFLNLSCYCPYLHSVVITT